MGRRARMRRIADDVKDIRTDIDTALDQGLQIPYDGKENTMNNEEEIVPAATEDVRNPRAATPATPATPATGGQPATPATPAQPNRQNADDVDVVVTADTAEELAEAVAADQAESDANLSDTDALRGFSVEELQARGVPATSIPRNAANTAPDISPEKARELVERAKAAPNNVYVEGAEDSGQAAGGESGGESGGEVVG